MTTERTPKEHPILFSGPMVRALLDGRKTQTRRIVKAKNMIIRGDDGVWYDADCINPGKPLISPYGQPGDRLWVRETGWERRARTSQDIRNGADTWPPFLYDATEDASTQDWCREHKWKRRPSIHMPCWASRIALEITDVRVERLQDISEENAKAEGIEWGHHEAKIPMEGYRMYGAAGITNDPILSYRTLWDSINGPGSWNANPFVWVVTFNRIKP